MNVLPTTANSWFHLLVFLGLTFLVGTSGGWISDYGWYERLEKPALTPPGWVFGPVWTVLYMLMALAAWLVFQQAGMSPLGKTALALYAAQLLLNGAWSTLFFGLKRPDWALAEIAVLWLSIGATLWAFSRISVLAAWLLLPYLAWVSFAAWLNYGFWRLNA